MFNFSIFKKKKNEEQKKDANLTSEITTEQTTESSSNENNVIAKVEENIATEQYEKIQQPEKRQYDRRTPRRPQIPNTVYNALVKIRQENFSRKDLRRISVIIKAKYQNAFGENLEPEKIMQKEGDATYEVYCYPEEMRKEMFKIINWFFKIKETTAVKHHNLLKTQTLAKLKKIGSPDYERELVKFNIEEDERRKQEKNKPKPQPQFQQRNNQQRRPSTNRVTTRSSNFNRENADNKPRYNRNTNRTSNNGIDKPNFAKRRFTPNEARVQKENKNVETNE